MQAPAPQEHAERGPATVAPSLLRLSIAQRMTIAAVLAATLWAAVGWALDRIGT
jgi:hypothetical protein